MVSPLRRRKTPRLEVLEDEESVARRAAEIFHEAMPKKVVLAGGRTPKRAYELISQLDLPWSEMDLFLSDERFVPLHDERANERMLRRALGARANQARVHGFSRTGGPEESAREYAQEVVEYFPFDLTLLGLGEDGHTASLFAADPRHDRIDVMAFECRPDPQGPWRTTLSLAALNRSSLAVFLVTGKQKEDALANLVEGDAIPAAKVDPEGDLLILADEAASHRLT